MALKVLIIFLSLFASGLLVGNELAVAVLIHPVLYSISDEAHVRVVFAILQMLIRELHPLRGAFAVRPRSS
ncbi:MAG TPA: hypothetical protein VNO32_49355 [Candidatus Acidoferrum sp.]|nr:hypothetical protein [Candidatus Acidoferrum sp.]